MLLPAFWIVFMIHWWVLICPPVTLSANPGRWVSASTTSELAPVKVTRARSKGCFRVLFWPPVLARSNAVLAPLVTYSPGDPLTPLAAPPYYPFASPLLFSALYLEALLRELCLGPPFSLSTQSQASSSIPWALATSSLDANHSHVAIL